MISTLLKPAVVVNGKKYKIMKQIGEGGFAFVYNVMSVNKADHGERYALKKMICQTDEQLEEAKKEIDMMTKIKHVNILSLLEFAYVLNKKDQKEALLILPLYQGSVQGIIDGGAGYPNCAFSDGLDVLKILRQCVEGLAAIHACGMRHADLKPANILITESYQAVITDFGSVQPFPIQVTSRAEALVVEDKASMFTTASYRAPELFNTPSACIIGCESDIWSLGCIMYCMFYSRSPFESTTEGLSTLSVVSAQYPIPDSNLWPQEYLDVVAQCLTAEPSRRASLAAVKTLLDCIPCPPLNLHITPPPPSSSTITADGKLPRHPMLGSNGSSVLFAGLDSTTSTSSSAVSTGQIAFSTSSASFTEVGVSVPGTPTTPTVVASAPMNFAQFPSNLSATEGLSTGDSEAYVTHLSDVRSGSKDEFASCGSALSGLIFDDHNMEGSSGSVADSYVIESMSNLSTGNNSPNHHPSHSTHSGHQQQLHRGLSPRSNASFEGFVFTHGPGKSSNSSLGEAAAVGIADPVGFQSTVSTSAQSTAIFPSDGAGSEKFDSEEEFGEFTEAADAASTQSAPAAAQDVASLPSLDLWRDLTVDHDVVKEGAVYMMRMGGFPKKMTKKQVHLTYWVRFILYVD